MSTGQVCYSTQTCSGTPQTSVLVHSEIKGTYSGKGRSAQAEAKPFLVHPTPSLCIDDKDFGRIAATLDEFHVNKQSIIAAGVHQGKGSKTINNWQIPKLELMQSIVTSIRNSGVIAQWSADVTEHTHITKVKDPAQSSNNNNYNPQICRYLDRTNKCNRFDLTTSLLDRCDNPGVVGEESAEEDDELDNDTNSFPAELLSSSQSPGQPHPITDYFSIAKYSKQRKLDQYHSHFHATVDEIAIMFGLPDLRLAITNFLHCKVTYGNHIHSIGGPRRAAHGAELPFDKVQVWFKIRLQETKFHNPHNIRRAQMLNCTPPSDPWTLGRYDLVIIQTSSGHSWPASSLSGTFFLSLLAIITKLKNDLPQGTPLHKSGSSFGLLAEAGHDGLGTINT
ncbi:hypothetical protein EDB19DRAFT_1914597 [Suillus lakei]|nr:hypothetical protein EDB19DRAFT_1914597 [Suillus lakei]